MINTKIATSKKLAYLLRHSKLPDPNGWVEVVVIVAELSITLDELEQVVANDPKGRFAFSKDRLAVRALYGHSTRVNLELKSTPPPSVLYHGTTSKYLPSIMKEGLKPRSRRFVHLSETEKEAIEVGSRHGHPAVLKVDAQAVASQGQHLFLAKRGVWLTESVAPQYLTLTN